MNFRLLYSITHLLGGVSTAFGQLFSVLQLARRLLAFSASVFNHSPSRLFLNSILANSFQSFNLPGGFVEFSTSIFNHSPSWGCLSCILACLFSSSTCPGALWHFRLLFFCHSPSRVSLFDLLDSSFQSFSLPGGFEAFWLLYSFIHLLGGVSPAFWLVLFSSSTCLADLWHFRLLSSIIHLLGDVSTVFSPTLFSSSTCPGLCGIFGFYIQSLTFSGVSLRHFGQLFSVFQLARGLYGILDILFIYSPSCWCPCAIYVLLVLQLSRGFVAFSACIFIHSPSRGCLSGILACSFQFFNLPGALLHFVPLLCVIQYYCELGILASLFSASTFLGALWHFWLLFAII